MWDILQTKKPFVTLAIGVAREAYFVHSKISFVSAVTPLALPRGGADIRIVRQCHTRSVML